MIERRFELSGRQYIGHLSTISAYLQLSCGDPQAALRSNPGRATSAGHDQR
jgi:hypothetical protein